MASRAPDARRSPRSQFLNDDFQQGLAHLQDNGVAIEQVEMTFTRDDEEVYTQSLRAPSAAED